MIKIGAGFAVFLMLATIAEAGFAPVTSPIPRLRKQHDHAGKEQSSQEITTLLQIAELERQEKNFRKAKEAAGGQTVSIGLSAIIVSPYPRIRPDKFGRVNKAKRTTTQAPVAKKINRTEKLRLSRRGSVCGVRSIKGTAVPRIRGRGACGIANPVKITEVSGVALTRELTVNCKTAKQLDKWVSRSAKPTIGRKGGGLEAIQIIGGYSCRNRNSRRGAKLSEHAKGNAVDIAGFKLRNGTIYSVKRNWRGRGSRTLRRLHRSACGPFGTVLGPNSDRHHRDHFHFDTARHRRGAYCR